MITTFFIFILVKLPKMIWNGIKKVYTFSKKMFITLFIPKKKKGKKTSDKKPQFIIKAK